MPESLRVPGSGGLTLHGLSWSEAGVPLMLLHGFGNDAHVWELFAPVVAPYYRTLALDLRGHGDSDRDPEARYDYPFHVEDLERALEALEIERLVLVGHSFGGRVASFFAGAHPDRLAGLVLVDTGPEFDERGTSRIRTDTERTADASFASPADFERAMARAYPAAKGDSLQLVVRHALRQRKDGRYERKTDPRWGLAAADATAAEREARSKQMSQALWDILARVPCPTLVVRGAASDVLSPEVADRMAESLPQGRLALVPRAGHSVMVDNPDGFAEAVSAFALGDA